MTLTNAAIHAIAELSYDKRRKARTAGHVFRIGYVVLWERRKADGSPLWCRFNGVESHRDIEGDCAGNLYKDDAFALARRIAADGYTGVRVQRVMDNNGSELDTVRISADSITE